MKWAFEVYSRFVRISLSQAAAYRWNFIFVVIISFFNNMLLPLVTVLIYSAGAVIPGWSFHEALLIQAVFMLCAGVGALLFSNVVWETMSHIREGTYDLLMIRPGSVIFVTVAGSFDITNAGVFLGGVVMFSYALSNLPVPGVLDWLKFGFLFLMGVMLSGGLVLIMAATTFKWVGNSRIYEIYDAITTLGRYPGTVYAKGLMNAITYVIPVAMLGFFPASAILGRWSPGMFLAAIPCVLFMVLGILLFRRMVYLYQSAGG